MPNTSAEKPLEDEIDLYPEDYKPLHVPTDHSVIFQTSKGKSQLIIQNTSATSSVTFYINPAAPEDGVPADGEIPPNDFKPRRFDHNWKGAKLRVSNGSQQEVEMVVTMHHIVNLDGSYELLHFTVQKAIVPLIEGTRLTAKFDNGKLSGSGGINDYTASYSTSKDVPPSEISISEVASTLMGGPQPIVDQEHRFFEELHAAALITYGDGTIALTPNDKQKSLVLGRL